MAEIFGKKYIVDNTYSRFLILRLMAAEKENSINQDAIDTFRNRY